MICSEFQKAIPKGSDLDKLKENFFVWFVTQI